MKKNQPTVQIISFSKDRVCEMLNILSSDGEVIVKGLGTFKVKKMKERNFLHNKSHKMVMTKSHKKLTYTPTLSVKEHTQTCKILLK